MVNQELQSNEYFLIVSNRGDYFKTKSEEELNKVSFWKGVIFSKKVKSNKYLFYKCSSQTYKKLISQLKIAISYSKNYWYDIENLDLHNHNSISKFWIGGKEDDEFIEKL